MKIKQLFLLIFVFINSSIISIPEPYAPIKTLPADYHGGAMAGNRHYIESFIKRLNPEVIVEVGTWLGETAFFMASLVEKKAKIYAVDTWLGSKEHPGMPDWSSRLPRAYQQFLSNCKHMKLTDMIIPVRMSSLEAADALNIYPKLVYIDASHEEDDVFHDVIAWWKKLSPGGILCGDDWTWESVRNGVAKAAKILNETIHFDFNFWYFDPKK